jgi:phosphoenolpyruvate carboxykinase (ATP)
MSEDLGVRNPSAGIDLCGLNTSGLVRYNCLEAELVELAVARGEAILTAHGALRALTGQHTGRSAKDKFVVRDANTDSQIWWDNNKPMTPEAFDTLHADMLAHAKELDLFVQDLVGGADEDNALNSRVITEYAWHALFIRNLLIRPDRADLTGFMPELTIINLPSFRADPARHGCRTDTVIAVDLERRLVLIGGTSYAGEMKKSVFSMLNFLLPAEGVMPMHASANVDGPTVDVAVFFGLSGRVRRRLSADPARTLIGDDEHGWGEDGVFNFEGGCYAKTINGCRAKPNRKSSPRPSASARCWRMWFWIQHAHSRFRRWISLTREHPLRLSALHFIPNALLSPAAPAIRSTSSCSPLMRFGVMPPLAKLTPEQAMYHFLSGYTAKVAGTEKGVTEPEATFSTCFGAPFMPRHPSEYGDLLRRLISEHAVNCWLVNTGWTGGAYGEGQRMPIKATRALLSAALDGSIDGAEYRTDANFGFAVPVAVEGVDSTILDPRSTWADQGAYDAAANRLVGMFIENFAKFEDHVDGSVLDAAPGFKAAAE